MCPLRPHLPLPPPTRTPPFHLPDTLRSSSCCPTTQTFPRIPLNSHSSKEQQKGSKEPLFFFYFFFYLVPNTKVRHMLTLLHWWETYDQDLANRRAVAVWYLSKRVHFLQVSAAQSNPAAPAIGVVHFLRWYPRLRPPVRRNGKTILPPCGSLRERWKRAGWLAFHNWNEPHQQSHLIIILKANSIVISITKICRSIILMITKNATIASSKDFHTLIIHCPFKIFTPFRIFPLPTWRALDIIFSHRSLSILLHNGHIEKSKIITAFILWGGLKLDWFSKFSFEYLVSSQTAKT